MPTAFLRRVPGGLAEAVPPAGAAAVTEIELDFGSPAVRSRTFTVADAAVNAASRIVMTQSGKTATGKSGGEAAFDAVICVCAPGAGAMTVEAFAVTGPVSGKMKFNYLIG